MPTYDYQCRSCERVTEVIHAMTAQGPATCEHCGGELRRVLYPAGIIFKGSGFYRTDSRRNGSEATPGSSSPEKPTGSTNPPTGADGGGTPSTPSSSRASGGEATSSD